MKQSKTKQNRTKQNARPSPSRQAPPAPFATNPATRARASSPSGVAPSRPLRPRRGDTQQSPWDKVPHCFSHRRSVLIAPSHRQPLTATASAPRAVCPGLSGHHALAFACPPGSLVTVLPQAPGWQSHGVQPWGPVCAHSVVTCCSLMALDATEMLTVAGFTLQSRPAHCLPPPSACPLSISTRPDRDCDLRPHTKPVLRLYSHARQRP